MQNYRENSIKIVIALSIGIIAYFLGLNLFSETQSRLLGLIAVLVVLWTNEVLPIGIVSLLPIVLFPAFHVLDTKSTAMNYAHPIIYLFLGGFLLAIAVEKTKLHVYIADKILDFFPSTPKAMIFSLTLTSSLLSSILSNTTTALLLMTIAIFITNNPKLKMRFALAIAYGASVGGILTPIGTPPNLILLGVMQEHHIALIPFFQWMWMVAPLVFLMLVSVTLLLGIGVGDIKIDREVELQPLDAPQKKVIFLLFSLITIGIKLKIYLNFYFNI